MNHKEKVQKELQEIFKPKKLTPEQLINKRIRELRRAIRSCPDYFTRKTYKEHIQHLQNQLV